MIQLIAAQAAANQVQSVNQQTITHMYALTAALTLKLPTPRLNVHGIN